ncbi:erythromycin esterase family protein [Actinoplanes sp. NPDC048796]|uniref:erythromycin esterase family protein n=1 Tax=Actinoplanes sp. NPDC048796 TaxID=3155640 RepID=UPI0033C9448E
MNISLSGLGDLVAGARVVALGESAHHVREYDLVRHQLLQFLVEEKGFTALVMESGFSEGLALTAWDGSGEFPEGAMTYRFGRNPEMRHLIGWARERGVAFYGLDLPGDLASMSPALDHLAAFEDVGAVRPHADKFASAFTMPALAAYRAMPLEDRDALTVGLAELSARFAVRHRGAAEARHELRLLVLLDQMLRATDPSFNVRDAAMAETVDWVRAQGHRKIVVAAANTHIQRVFPGLEVLGSHLAAAYGDDYLAIGLTAHGGVTPTRRPAPDAPAGAETVTVPLPPPVPGSVEDFLGPRPVIADLRPLRGRRGPDRIRLLDTWLEVPVADAYDLIVNLPEINPTPEGVWNGGR